MFGFSSQVFKPIQVSFFILWQVLLTFNYFINFTAKLSMLFRHVSKGVALTDSFSLLVGLSNWFGGKTKSSPRSRFCSVICYSSSSWVWVIRITLELRLLITDKKVNFLLLLNEALFVRNQGTKWKNAKIYLYSDDF